VTAADDLVIRAEGLTKRYGRTLALDGLDLAIPAGEVYGFLGPNGAGKTTTIRLLPGPPSWCSTSPRAGSTR
jgi:ABC-2 type transport system ATP-binding protein